MKLRIRFIINPISGIAKKGLIPKLIEKYLDHSKFDYDIAITEYRKHAKDLAIQSTREGIDIVCAVGGDGSVHEVGTALIDTCTTLAIIPAGSGNGLARHLNIPRNFKSAILTINELNFYLIDTVLVNDKPFLGTGGYGFDAHIAKKFDTHSKRGFWGYTSLIIREYNKYTARKFQIQVNDKWINERFVLCSIANSSEFGNGFVVSPHSHISDGTLELCLLKPVRFDQTPGIIYRFFRKTSDRSRFMKIIPFKKARIVLDQKIAHYDGEPFDVRKELNVEVVPKSLRILVGKK